MPRCAACHSPLPWLTRAEDADFDRVAGQSPLPVLVDLWAPWCGPCKAVAPGVEQAARKLAGRLKVVKGNVDHAPAVSARYDARSIPTLLILDNGKVKDRQVGAVPPDALFRARSRRCAAAPPERSATVTHLDVASSETTDAQ